VSGNALTMLLVADALKKSLEDGVLRDDLFAEQVFCTAIRTLLVCEVALPLNAEENGKFCVSDNPRSLFEGLSGAIRAWTVAPDSIHAKVRNVELKQKSSVARRTGKGVYTRLGFPGSWSSLPLALYVAVSKGGCLFRPSRGIWFVEKEKCTNPCVLDTYSDSTNDEQCWYKIIDTPALYMNRTDCIRTVTRGSYQRQPERL
jgi:hypothetical protein